MWTRRQFLSRGLGLGVTLAFLLGPGFAGMLGVYLVLTTAYSLYLKRQPILDVFVLAGLYTQRILAGGVAIDITITGWLLAFSIFFFFSLAMVKRYAELLRMDRESGQGPATASGRCRRW